MTTLRTDPMTTHMPSSVFSVRPLLASLALASLLTLSWSPTALAQSSRGALYYQLGGNSPGGNANNRSQIPLQLSLGANLRLNYSCGKFDIGLSWETLMNDIEQFGDKISNALKAGVAALPMYIFQRAQPGLFQLFQTYSLKADAMIAASLKTCEEMEAQIKQGHNPYADWENIAKGESWRVRASLNGDVVEAKKEINKNGEANRNGVSWIFGERAGGVGTQPLRPVRDLSVAGYNVTLNRQPAASGGGPADTRMVAAFPSSEALATFTTRVLGDQQIYLCEGIANCPAATSTSTATGLGPLLDEEIALVRPKLEAIVAGGSAPSSAALSEIGAPGIAVNVQVVEALRAMPPENRTLATGRLAHELGMQRVINKALVARNALITAMSLPEVTAAGKVTDSMKDKVALMTRHIEDLMFEHRIRKEITATNALAILEAGTQRDGQATRVSPPGRVDLAPVDGGRVKSTP
jgi:integrating conjugative element protein (TIGR03755 family)